MKIIDLLKKIANGEEVPKKVRYDDEIYDTEISNNFSLMIYEATGKMCDDGEVQLFLNDEIKIIEDKIEEEKKIPEKLDKSADVSGDLAYDWTFGEKKLKDKINEIIDYLKSKGDE